MSLRLPFRDPTLPNPAPHSSAIQSALFLSKDGRMDSSPGYVDLEIFLPVHNEAESIEATIREIHDELSKKLSVRFIICEDGSRDNSKEILYTLAKELPLRLNLSHERRGYSRAVRDGIAMMESDFLLCLDSDGQCDPRDFWQFWEARSSADLTMGWRVHRQDTLTRKLCSRFFYLIYQSLFRTPSHDPSCPYLLMSRRLVRQIYPQLGAMDQGFWWEFVARVHGNGFAIRELPVNHRRRAAGATQVYRWTKMPGIFVRHVAALIEIRASSNTLAQTQNSRAVVKE
jgi:dolichol-phosphate mannosyltransferase